MLSLKSITILQTMVLWCILRLNECGKCVEPPYPNEPSFSEVKDEYMDRVFGPLFHMLIKDQSKIHEIGLRSKNVFSQSKNKKCPKRITEEDIKNGHTSTCPFDIKFTYDKDRLPKVIPFAVCRCPHCVPVEGCSEECQTRTSCQPVYTYKTIYRKHCNARREVFEWVKDIAKIPVGCTCIVTS